MRRRYRLDNTNAGSTGIGLCEVVGVVFIILKLCGLIDWSWWLVLLPIYAPIVLVIAIIFVIFIVSFIKHSFKRKGG